MEDYQERVIEEAAVLTTKVVALRKFVDSPLCEGLSSRIKTLLSEQERHMTSYLHVLRDRIDGFQ